MEIFLGQVCSSSFWILTVLGYGAAGTIANNVLYLSHGHNYVRFADTFQLDLDGLGTILC